MAIAGCHDDPMTDVERYDAYLAALPADQRAALEDLADAIEAAAPDAERGISYGAPAYRLGGRPLAGFSAARAHLSYLPFSPAVITSLAGELEGWQTSKGAVRFTPDHPLPAGWWRRWSRPGVRSSGRATPHRGHEPRGEPVGGQVLCDQAEAGVEGPDDQADRQRSDDRGAPAGWLAVAHRAVQAFDPVREGRGHHRAHHAGHRRAEDGPHHPQTGRQGSRRRGSDRAAHDGRVGQLDAVVVGHPCHQRPAARGVSRREGAHVGQPCDHDTENRADLQKLSVGPCEFHG